jgi:bifunctional non-homologous end joining protein LigD
LYAPKLPERHVPETSKLSKYRGKRDFSKTAEPSGAAKVVPSNHRRFVIQKHDARRLHYDLRLELDGVFKSWAVTRGPSLDPHDKRLAVEVEDHPLDYGDFEGTIPKDEYGGGTVQLWDRGFWDPEGNESPEKALAGGSLKFSLDGERLHGSWALVRIKNDRSGNKRTNWLLIKHRDEYAKDGRGDAVLEEDRSVASGRSMAAIASGTGAGPKPFMLAKKTAAKADAVWNSNRGEGGVAEKAPKPPRVEKATAKAAPDKRAAAKGRAAAPLPDFIAPQLCQLVERPSSGAGWVHEIKFDGYRIQLRVQGGEVTLKTRSALDWTRKFGAIAKEAALLPDAIIDGEIVALDHHGNPDFAALQAALSEEKTGELIFYAFDLLFDETGDLRGERLVDRKALLDTMLANRRTRTPRIRFVEHFETAGDAVLRSACQLSLEGIVSKRLSARYESGRSSSWTKAKCRAGHEVVIGGYSTEQGRFRSLLVGVHRGEHFAYVGRVGTGFGEKKRDDLVARLKRVAARRSPFTGAGAPRSEPGVVWVKPELVAEIEFAGWTGSGMVRQAAFKGLREDKPAAEVQAEKPQLVKQAGARPSGKKGGKTAGKAAGKPAARKAATKAPAVVPEAVARPAGKPVVMGVPISNPDKAMWPDAGGDGQPVTKLDLARYFEEVGGWMLPHIAGRPCSIIRAPDGFAAEKFFQRHAVPGTSNLLELVTVSGDRKPYLEIDRVEGLAAVAQVAALELHPWNNQPGQPDVPGRLVFDLDPGPELGFDAVIEAAKELRERLDAVGLVSFCKTTGGKGLHVVTPLANSKSANVTWAIAKEFARQVCVRMAADAPDRYVVNMAKKVRPGRIFLDYLRNDRMATAVAPLSPRAREGATVSMPLTWAQVKAGLDPRRFTVRSVPPLLRKTRAWVDYDDAARPLDAAIGRFAKVEPAGA